MKYFSIFLTLLVIGCTSTNVLKTNSNHCSYTLSDTLIGYQDNILSVYKAVQMTDNGIYSFNMTNHSFTTVKCDSVVLIETIPLSNKDVTVGDVLLNSGKIIIVAEKDTLNDNTFNCIYNNTNELINLNFNSYGEIQLLLRLYMPDMFTTEAMQYVKSNTNTVKQIYFQEVLKILQNQ
jgi:hypothetical protein